MVFWAICFWKLSSTVLLISLNNSLSKVWKVLGSHFSEVVNLLDEYWARKMQRHLMSSARRCVDQTSAVNNFVVFCLTFTFDLSHPNMKIQHTKSRFATVRVCEIWRFIYPRFSVFDMRCWNSLNPFAILRGTQPISRMTCALLSCCAIYIYIYIDIYIYRYYISPGKCIFRSDRQPTWSRPSMTLFWMIIWLRNNMDEENEASLAKRRRKNMTGIKEIAQAPLTYFEKANGNFYWVFKIAFHSEAIV